MGRAPCCSKVGLHRGPWTAREDALLTNYIHCHGEGNWRSLPKKAGLLRCGKSCRLRWMNYLRPDIKRGNIGPEEEDLIIRLHSLLGNRWSLIAGRLPGRTDNEIKNYWNSHLSKKLKRQGIELREGAPKPCTTKRSSMSSSPTATKNVDKRSKNKKKLPIIQEEERENTPKTKIHAPKPTRLTLAMRNSSNATTEPSQGSDRNVESNSSEDERGDIMSWSEVDNFNEGSLFNDSDHSVGLQSYYGMDCDFQYELLDRVYQEYSQLLTADQEDQFPLFSFTESLLL